MSKQSDPRPIALEIEGKIVEGNYSVDAGLIHVSSFYGSKSTQIGGHQGPALPQLARRLLREIFEEAR